MKLLEDAYKNSPPESFTSEEWEDGYITKKDAWKNSLCKGSTIADAARYYFRVRSINTPTDKRPRVVYALKDVYLYAEKRNGPGSWLGNLENGIYLYAETNPWDPQSKKPERKIEDAISPKAQDPQVGEALVSEMGQLVIPPEVVKVLVSIDNHFREERRSNRNLRLLQYYAASVLFPVLAYFVYHIHNSI